MGRTIPSYRLALAKERSEWKAFRDALAKPEKMQFDEMFSIPLMYISACSCAVKPFRLQPALMSILFHHYKHLLQTGTKIGVMHTSLFPDEDAITKLIMAWQGYSDALPKRDRESFGLMLKECNQYSQAINSKSEPFADDALFMTLIFLQHKMMDSLFKCIAELKAKS